MQPSTKPSTFAFFSSLLFLLSANASAAGCNKATTWTHIRVYYHEALAGPHQTAFVVASLPQSNSSSSSTIQLGQVRVSDNPLTEGPSPRSKLVGRAQGMGSVVSADPVIFLEMNHVFTAGRFNGSTLATFGTIHPTVDVAEQTVVGGSGQFRMARGYMRRKLVAVKATAITLRFDFYAEHY